MPGTLARLAMNEDADREIVNSATPLHGLALAALGADEPTPRRERPDYAGRFIESPETDLFIGSRTSVSADAEAYARRQPGVSLYEQATSGIDLAVQNFATTFTSVPKLVARGQAAFEDFVSAAIPPMTGDEAVGRAFGVAEPQPELRDYWLYRQAEKVDDYIESKFPVDEKAREQFLTQLIGGAGSMAAFMLGGEAAAITKLFPTVVIALLGAAAEGSQGYESAKRAGISEDDARAAMDWHSLLGTTEVVGEPLAALRVLNRMDKAVEGGIRATVAIGGRRVAASTAFEAGQEAAQQLGGNIVDRAYGQNRGLFDGVLQAGGIGGILGGIAQGFAQGVKAIAERQQAVDVAPVTPPATLTETGPMTVDEAAIAVSLLSLEARAAILADHEQRVAAGQKDPTPSKEFLRAQGVPEETAEGTRAERAAFVETLKQEPSNVQIEREQGEPAQSVPEAPRAEGPVADVLEPTPETTSLKQAVVAEERTTRGEPQIEKILRLTNQEALDFAKATLGQNSTAGYELVAALQKDLRAKTPQENALLLLHKAAVIQRHNQVLSDLVEAQNRGDTEKQAELEAENELRRKQRDDIDQVSDPSGGLAGQALQSLKMMIDVNDFSLSTMEKNKRADLGRALTPDELSVLKTEQVKGEKLRKELAEALAGKEQAESKLAAQEALNEALRKAAPPKAGSKRHSAARKKVEDAWKEILAETGGKLFSVGAQLEAIPSWVKLAKAYIELGVVKFQDFYADVRKRLGDEKARQVNDVAARAWSQAIEESRPQPRGELKNNETVARFARELAEFFASTGITELDPMIDAVHGEMAKAIPGFTRDQANDALGRYGIYKALDMDPVKVIVRDLQGQARETAKIREMEAGRPPKATGQERPTPTQKQRLLIKKVNVLKKKGGFVAVDRETQLKSWLQSQNTRLTNMIADLTHEIETRTRIVRERVQGEPDAENRRLMEIVAELRRQKAEIFGKPELTDEQRLKRAIAAAERTEKLWTARLDEAKKGVFVKGKRVVEPITNEKLEAIKAHTDAIRAEVQELRDIANPKLTPDERATSRLNTSIARRIADYQDRIARGDFAPKTRKITKPDKETEHLRFLDEQWRKKYQHEREVDRRKNRTVVRKIADVGADVVFNVSRALMFGIDFSYTGLQGGLFYLGHPIRASHFFMESLRAMASEEAASEQAYALTQRANAKSGGYKRWKVQFSDPHGSLRMQEEVVASSLAERIPLLKNLARAWTSYMNNVRADWMDILVDTCSQRSGTITDARGKVLANAVNVATGRGNFGYWERGVPLLNAVFLAPKYVASRFELIVQQPLWRGDAVTRMAIAKEMGRTLAGFAALHGLIAVGLQAAFGAPGDDKYWDMNFDPTNKKKMGIRIGPRTIDTSAGIFSALRYLARTGIVISGSKSWAKAAGIERPGYELAGYGRGKLAPIPGAVVSRIVGTTMESRKGHPVKATWATLGKGLVIPINAKDIKDSMISYGMPAEQASSLLNLFGINVKTDIYKHKRAG